MTKLTTANTPPLTIRCMGRLTCRCGAQIRAIDFELEEDGVHIGPFVGLLAVLKTEHIILDAATSSAPIRTTVPGDDDLIAIQMPCIV
jgi:hypothetical protein